MTGSVRGRDCFGFHKPARAGLPRGLPPSAVAVIQPVLGEGAAESGTAGGCRSVGGMEEEFYYYGIPPAVWAMARITHSLTCFVAIHGVLEGHGFTGLRKDIRYAFGVFG